MSSQSASILTLPLYLTGIISAEEANLIEDAIAGEIAPYGWHELLDQLESTLGRKLKP